MTADAAGLVAVGLLIGLIGFFAVCETVLTRVGVVQALRLKEQGHRGADRLLWLAEHPARGLNVVLLLTIATHVAAAALLTALLLPAGGGATVAGLVVFVLVSFVLADVVPRSYTLRHLESIALSIAPMVVGLARALRPVVRVLVAAGGAVAGRSGAGPFASDEELRRLLDASVEAEVGELEEDERAAMIHSIFELGDTVVREIMVPRPDMVTVSADDTLHMVVDTIVARGFSRIPVWRGSRDNIVGVLYAKDMLQRLSAHGDPTRVPTGWTDVLREPTFVPESKRVDELLRALQRQKIHLAIVVDEHGGVAGLVTIEDILEEIVGEIVDEYDHEEPPVTRIDERRLRVSARVTVHDLNELLDADLPEDEGWDTVGGLLIGLLGRVPEPGEAVKVDGVTLAAERVQGRRVAQVLITLPGEAGPGRLQGTEAAR